MSPALLRSLFILPLLLVTAHSQFFLPHPLFGGSGDHEDNSGGLRIPGLTITQPQDGGFASTGFGMFSAALKSDYKGAWELVSLDSGANAMHVNLLPNNKVIMYDATAFRMSTLKLPNGECIPYNDDRGNPNQDCWCHAVEFNIDTAAIRPLKVHFEFRSTLIYMLLACKLELVFDTHAH